MLPLHFFVNWNGVFQGDETGSAIKDFIRLCPLIGHNGQETKSNLKSLVFADDEFELIKQYSDKNYIKLTKAKKNELKLRKLFALWRLRNSENISKIKQKISDNYGLNNFYFMLILKKTRCLNFFYMIFDKLDSIIQRESVN